jgi:HPt (histidine-containing phosphotransfer) domain-containing protein
VALTANAVVGAREMFAEAGMDDFISKPIDEARINQILTRWLPEEKIDYNHAGVRVVDTEQEYASHIFTSLANIEELDIRLGLFHVGGNKAVYISVLRQFCNEMTGYLNNIKRYLWDGDVKNYKIVMHAAKGMFNNIGVKILSEWAYQLEYSDLHINDDEHIAGTLAFCEDASKFCVKLLDTGLMKGKIPTNKQTTTEEELERQLEILTEACLTGDSDKADEIQIWLTVHTFDETTDIAVSDICGLLSTYEYETAVEKINKLRGIAD